VPRKRLRSLFQEVIADSDLQENAARVAAPTQPVDAAQAPTIQPPAQPRAQTVADATAAPGPGPDTAASANPAAFPPPPWEVPPVVPPVKPHNGHPPDVGSGSPIPQGDGAALSTMPPPETQSTPRADVAAPIASPAARPAYAPSSPGAFAAPPSDAPGQPVLPASAEVPIQPVSAAPPGQPPLAWPSAMVPAGAPPLRATSSLAPPAAAVLLGPSDAQISRRRRRSASLLPPLPSPIDIPEDAPGRVAILSIPAPPDSAPAAALGTDGAALTGDHAPGTNPGHATASADTAPNSNPAVITGVAGPAGLSGWLPVLALALVLVVLFVVGVLVTH
jgi:hypothetical protein